ncbi:glutamate racemase [Sphingomonas sp. SM33]|uniref:Glutamate racemase n=1 Tax=Sphingomonas telluris TaxID=2907998 RepID=A0ABS9VJG3_9SPHN|nr:glutamate racemase [Sphingomonas telluris]MCH8615120.1 glutamate racemase [Sphingomonas telluris]
MDANSPILFFDSGVGGLSVLEPTRALLPNAPFIYVADNAGYPYGKRSEAEIASRVPALLGRLVERFHPRLAVIACNTASTIALDQVRSALDLPVVGTVPAIKPAAELSKNRVIGVLGTEATVRQPYVDNLAAEFAADCTIVRHGAPDLVDLAEAKLAGEDVTVKAVRAAAQPMFDAEAGDRIDVGVLACTHFPLLLSELEQAFPGVTWIDGGPGIARRIAYLTREQPWPSEPEEGIMVFTAEPRSPLLGTLAQYGIGDARTI